MIKKIVASIREYKKPTILSIIFVGLEAIIECLVPLAMTILVDLLYAISDIKANKSYMLTIIFEKYQIELSSLSEVTNFLIIISVILVVMAGTSLLFGFLSGNECAKASTGLAKNLREDLYKSITNFSFSNIDKFSSSSLVTRMTTDVSNVQMSFMMIIRTAIRSPLMLIFSITMAFIISPNLAWIFMIIIPVLFGVFLFIISRAMPTFTRVFKKYDKLNNSVQENISGIRTVKSFVREDYEIEKFNNANDEVRKDFTKAERIVAWNGPAMNLAIYAINLVVIFLGAKVIVNSQATALKTAGLSSLTVYGFQSLMSLTMLSMIIVMVTMSIESARRINEVLIEKPSIVNPKNPVYEVKDGSIEFNNVSFKYSEKAEKYALSNINLKIKSGMTVGILGGTGSSKTTLVNLISRLYDVTEGEVIVGGVNVKDYDIETLRHQVSVVLQKNLLFSGTIKENLRWGKEDATDEEIIAACKQSCADEFIEKFNEKYDFYVEQGGANLSGGQKQRLCIARALIKRPKVLIFDDSTSAVDTKTDAIIRKSIKEAIPNTTKIIIAQRVSSIQDSDLIICMNNGTIDGMGTHEELLKTNNIYQEVYYSQNKLASKGGN
ncbi:MAG: ABC transporter ATP-binding protein [Bacillales bacterium]|nr:ABC transporter ATP-binding protein [Bacillales bacterium]